MSKYLISEKLNNKKISDFFEYYHLGKSKRYQILQSGSIKCNDEIIKNDNFIIKSKDIVEIEEQINSIVPFDGQVDIVYEDQDVVIVNKPYELLVHDDGNTKDTLLNRLSSHYKNQKVDLKCIHRIDYETRGLVLFTKTILGNSFLNYQMENGLIKKTYQCVVHGNVKKEQGFIDAPIGKNRHEQNKYIVCKNGKSSKTEYKVLKRKDDRTLLSVNLITGRTHQIRVHMSYKNHPLVSDKIYYKYENVPLALLSFSLEYIDPVTLKIKKVSLEKGLEI